MKSKPRWMKRVIETAQDEMHARPVSKRVRLLKRSSPKDSAPASA
jgi:hypothetical protein